MSLSMLVLEDGYGIDRPLVRTVVCVWIPSNRYPACVYLYIFRLTFLLFVYGVSVGGVEWRFLFIHNTNQVLFMRSYQLI